MYMTMRWFDSADDVTLADIAQVPCVRGIVGTCEDIPVGAVWPLHKLLDMKARVEAAGLTLDVIESIPVHETIKMGTPGRDTLIDAYCESVWNMGRAGIPVLCYNFMPVVDWMRTSMLVHLADGSAVTGYAHDAMLALNLADGLAARVAWAKGFTGSELQAALDDYATVNDAVLLDNLAYFLQRVVPVAEAAGVRLALHPDDPPWPIMGLPRIVTDAATIQRILDLIDSPNHGITFCTGSLGTSLANDLPAMARQFTGRINFVHMRNVLVTGPMAFHEVAHPSEHGSVDMAAVMRALIETGFAGPIRPDHGRAIWGKTSVRVGYGLYDRALGAMYLHGLYEGIRHAL